MTLLTVILIFVAGMIIGMEVATLFPFSDIGNDRG